MESKKILKIDPGVWYRMCGMHIKEGLECTVSDSKQCSTGPTGAGVECVTLQSESVLVEAALYQSSTGNSIQYT